MSHHSGPDGKAPEFLAELFKQQDTTDHIHELQGNLLANQRFGATGKFPQGTLGDDDEGELEIGMTSVDGKVVLAFGKSIDWIGFGPEQARALAQTLLDRAAECDGISARVRRVVEEM